MATTIPTVTGPRVQSQGMAAPRVNLQTFGDPMADVVGKAAQMGMSIYEKEREHADNAALLDAETKLDTWKNNTLYNPDNGVYSKRGKNALDVTNQTLPEYDKQAQTLGETLTNDRQRERWNQIVTGKRQGLNGELNRYEFGQRNQYYDDADNASLRASGNAALLYSDDPGMVKFYQTKAASVIVQQGQRKGLPDELINQQVLENTSKTNLGIISKKAATDPADAQKWYTQNLDNMTADDRLTVEKTLNDAVIQATGTRMANQMYQNGTPGVSNLSTLIMGKESGGQVDAVSSKGALGLMQVMPDTAKEVCKQLGIAYDPQRMLTDPHYNATIGQTYLNNMLQRYGGNATLATAAYNAGPGAVDEWIKKYGDPRKIGDQAFIDQIPYKETREYTDAIHKQLIPRQPGSVAYAEAYQRGQEIANPKLRKAYEDRLSDLKKADDLKDTANYEQAAEYVMQGGFASIPSALSSQLKAADKAKLMDMDEKRRKGIQPVTDEDKLRGFLSMPSDQLARLSLARDVRPYLNDADYKTVHEAWNGAQKGDETKQQAAKAKSDIIDNGMAYVGILTGDNQKAKAPANLERQRQYKAALQQQISAFKADHEGREPNQAELQNLTDTLALTVRMRDTTGWFGGDKKSALWEVPPEDLGNTYMQRQDLSIKDIPAEDRRKIGTALRLSGKPLTEENMVQGYLEKISGLGAKVTR